METSELLKRLEQRLPLVEELAALVATGSFLSFLRTEIGRDVAGKIQGELRNVEESCSREIGNLAAEVKAVRSIVMEETSDLRSSLSDLKSREPDVQEQIATVTASLGEVNSSLFTLRSDIDQKPSHRDLSRISEKLLSFASQRDVDNLESAVRRCAEKEELANLEERLTDLKGDFSEYPNVDKVEEMLRQLEHRVAEWVRPLAPLTALEEAKVALQEALASAQSVSDTAYRQLTSDYSLLKKELADAKSIVEAQPWKKDHSFLLDELGKKASRLEIRQFKEEGTSILQSADRKLKEVTETLHEYDSVLQHYDEVLLLKASRDDIKALSLRFDSSLDTSGIKTQLAALIAEFGDLKEELETVAGTVSRDRDRLEEVIKNQALVLGKKDSLIDPSVVFGSLSDLRDMVTAKADRTDVYHLSDAKCDKTEIGLISGDVHTVKKQLESLAGTLYAFIKGYVDEEPSWLLAEKQKTHLLGHSLSLLNWISGSDGRQEEVETPSRPRTRTLSTRKKTTLSSSLPQVTFTTPKTRPRTRKDSQASIYSPSKTLLESVRW